MNRYLRQFTVSLLFGVLLVGILGCTAERQATAVPLTPLVTEAAPAATETVPAISGAQETTATSLPPAAPTAIATATAVPTTMPSPSPTATATAEPTDSPPPTPTATAVPLPGPDWLSYLNRFRAMAKLPLLVDQDPYTLGSRLHSRYMVGNDEPIAHFEEEEKPFYDPAGDQAARNGNIFATSQMEADYMWSINFWVSAPFHLLEILDPSLEAVGYGDYVEATGATQMAGVLDIGSHPPAAADGIEYPIMFPGDGSETWVVRHSLFEWPYPFDGCPGFAPPTGPPIVLLLGDGSGTPSVTSHRFAKGDQALETCIFDETTYRNNDPYAQKIGREVLNHNDAIVIMPREPLAIDQNYSVQVEVDGQTYTWGFSTRRGPDS